MSVVHIHSKSELDKILGASNDKLTVLYAHALWCGPCVAFKPIYEGYPTKYPSVNFLKVDVDAVPDVARHYGVTAMPTFFFLKGGAKVEQIRGAQPTAVENAIKKHMSGGSGGTFQGKGNTLGTSANATASPVAADIATGLSPQIKTLLAIFGVYVLFWYLGK